MPNNRRSDIEVELKQLIIETFDLDELTVDDIDSDTALFGGGVGLDSIDALELGLALKNTYDIKIDPANDQVNQYFSSVSNLANFIENWQNQQS